MIVPFPAAAVSFVVPAFELEAVAVKEEIPFATRVPEAPTWITSLPDKSEISSEPAFTIKVSFPAPPVSVSSPFPPSILSLSSPPERTSALSPPVIISAPLPPVIISTPAPPAKVYAPAEERLILISLPEV